MCSRSREWPAVARADLGHHRLEPLAAFGHSCSQHLQGALVDKLTELLRDEERGAGPLVPLLKCSQVGDVDGVLGHRRAHIPVATGPDGHLLAGRRPHYRQLAIRDVTAQYRAGSDHAAVPDRDWTYRAALAAQEDGRLPQHDSTGHVAEQRRRRLIAARGEIKVHVGGSHLAMVGPTGPAAHQAVAKVDEAPEGHEREEDGLLQPDAVGAVSLFFEQRAFPDLMAQAKIRAVEEDRVGGVPALQRHIGAEPGSPRSSQVPRTPGLRQPRSPSGHPGCGIPDGSSRYPLRSGLRRPPGRYPGSAGSVC